VAQLCTDDDKGTCTAVGANEPGLKTPILARSGEVAPAYVTEVLMRGHGDAVVGPSLQVAVFRAIYTEVNANLQIQATMLGGPITFLNQYEAQKSQGMERTWEAWKRQALERDATRR
jgi:ribulose-5-phosphate 4-epimerase/fuculose-1-phosphate aldolase